MNASTRVRATLIALGAVLTLSATGSTKERTAGGKNYRWRKHLCQNAALESRSYALPREKLSPNVRIKSVRWVPGNYRVRGKKTWERKSPGGVCEMKAYIPRKRKTYTFFHDGCSGQAPGRPSRNSIRASSWGQLFHPACVKHDHCYHHEPSRGKRSRRTCDKMMRDSMYRICSREYGSRKAARAKCQTAATVMYTGVRVAGRKHYRFENAYAPYEDLYDPR